MALELLLRALADGRFHSGAELGRALGMSRTAVWKQLRRLDELGIELYSVRGRGYRIPGGLDLLDETALSGLLAPEAARALAHVELVLELPSTNGELMRRLAQGDSVHGTLLAAEQQSAGRGRRGRSWVSAFGANLCFSLGWRFPGGAGSLEGLSLLVGLAVSEGLADCGVDGIRLKWPNDLLRGDGKLAGILIELQGDATGGCEVVIGVGINVAIPRDTAQQIDQPWADCRGVEPPPGRNRLLAAVLNRLLPWLETFGEHGFAPFRERWNARNAHVGERVRLTTAQHSWEGICRGVNEAGALLLERNGQLEAYHGGELSLRVAVEA